MTVKKHRVYGDKTPSNGYKDTVFCADSGTSWCTLFAYVLDVVGKKRGKNAEKNGQFSVRKREKNGYFF
jgi:hypothetical protein